MALAQAAINIVVRKLANFIQKEMEHLGGVGEKVQWVQRELIRIRCYLRDADSKRKIIKSVQNWVNELRDVAYRIEDAIDMFFLRDEGVDDNLKEDSSCLPKLKKLRLMPQDMYHHHKLGTELDEIQNLLKEISESRVRYGIQHLQDIVGEAVRMPLRRATYSEVDETEVVGMEADKNNILELLRPERTPRRTVITIIGAGGLGKTTLACMVYKSAKADFDYDIMLSISQQFSLPYLLRKMISKYNNFVPKDRDVDYYVGEFKSFLISRRYLIILDDVWTGDLWNELKEMLPDNKNGSRILITSRLIEVAKSADSKMAPYKLNFLDDKESLDLLLKKAFPYQEPNEECPKDLLELAPKLSKKCKGLPLALIVLGGILATKELSYLAWERVLQTMNWHSDGNSCMQILAMSYEDMTYYLKACFQYLSSFPEDYVISAKCLIRMWVAEEFIPLEGKPTIQIMAEDCLEEIAKRSMVQVLSRSANGLIKYFKVHDILRELAMQEAREENFVTVFSHAPNEIQPNRIIRRASLQAEENNSQFMKYIGPNTRSLLLFEPKYPKVSLLCSNFRLLKVLEIVGKNLDQLVLKSLDELIHLKYLGLRRCSIDLSSCSIQRMRSLETLDVRGSTGVPPCDDFWSIGTLRNVLDGEFGPFFKRPLPKATDLSNLQTLKWVTLERACDANLPNLCKLGIAEIKSDQWISITNLLQTLPVLVSLGICAIEGSDLPMEIIYPKGLPKYQNLQSLYLRGKWLENVNVEASFFPPHLIKLSLRCTYLKQNPMPELGKLNSLKKLCLGTFALSSGWEGPIICPEGFPNLRYLKVRDENIKDLMVTQGVMPNLTFLQVYRKIKLHLPPQLQHVTVEPW